EAHHGSLALLPGALRAGWSDTAENRISGFMYNERFQQASYGDKPRRWGLLILCFPGRDRY
ncbi:jg19720, partial [Pararge aegeria aegeria]